MPPEKYPTGLAKVREDFLVVLGLALEAFVSLLWFIVEALLGLVKLLRRAAQRLLKQPPK